MSGLYLYRAPVDWLTPRLVTATAHPIQVSYNDCPPGLTAHRVTLRWAPPAGGCIRTQRDLLWTSSPGPLALAGYQRVGAEAHLQFRPSARPSGEGRPLLDRFTIPLEGPVTGQASLQHQVVTVRGRVGQTPFLRRLRAPDLRTGRWTVQGKAEGGQASLTLGPLDRPPLGARILAVRGDLQQPSARPLATDHVALEARLAIEAEWLDGESRRRVTDFTSVLRHLLPVPGVATDELLGLQLAVEELRWAPDRPVWALIKATIARYQTTFLPVAWTGLPSEQKATAWTPAAVLVGLHEATFAWTEPVTSSPQSEPMQKLELPFDHPVSRLLALDLHPGALDLLVGLKGGGLYLLTAPSPWRTLPPALTALALPGRIIFQP